MSRPSPTPEQRAAVETRDRHVLLEAGAGTGKTSALVDRFCASVLDDEVPVGRICAFTFTDRAAGEMRDRIRIRLRSLANEAQASEDHERAAELRTHVRAMEGAWISSIHGFCRRLLSSHPVAAGLDPRFRVLDPSEADRLAARAFEQALQDAVDTHGDDAVQLAAAFRVEGLQAMVRSAYSELRSRGERHPRLPEPSASDPGPCLANLASSAREALAEITELSNTAAEGWRGCIRRSIAIAERADGPEGLEMAELDGCVVTSKAKTFQGMAAQGWKDALDATIRCVAEATHEGRYRALQALVAAYSERYEEAKGRRGALDFEDLQLDAVGLLRTVPSVATRWQERFDHLLVDEFQDTNELQLSLIEQLAGPATRRFVVGDEFQSIYGFRNADIEVFRSQRRRAEAAEDWTKLALRGNFRSHPDILAVVNALGTASLDGFAPLTAGREPTEPAPGPTGPRVEMLVTDLAGWRDEDVRDAAGSDLDAPATRIAEARALAERLRELHDEGVPRQDMVVLLRAFAGSVDAYEDALERYGLDPYVVGGRGYWSHQQVTDTLNLLGVVANPLDDKALAGTLASPAVSVTPDTLWLLRRAAGSAPLWEMIDRWVAPDADGESAAPVAAEALAPGDGSAPQLSLDLPAAGGDGPGIDADADRRREQQRWTGEILDADRERLVTFAARLRDLRARAATLSLERLVDETVSAFDYDLALLSKAAGARRMANVRKLGRLAREYEEHEGRDLRGFLDEAAERTERDVEGEAATQAENHDGVRILTVHAAKGLEFAVVAVAELGRGLLSGGSPPALRFGTPAAGSSAPRVGVKMARLGRDGIALYDFEPLSDEAKEMESAEERRLAYVAATRAEQRLLLSGTAKLEPDIAIEPRTPIMARLAVALDVALSDPPATVQAPPPAPREGIEAELAPSTVAIRVNRASADRAHELAAGAATFLDEDGGGPEPEPIPLPPAERLAAQAAGSPAPSTLSPSALALYGRCGYRFYAERVLGLAPEGEAAAAGGGQSPALAFGSALHELLEDTARTSWRRPSDAQIRETLGSFGVEAGRADRAAELIDGWLASPLREELAAPGVRLRPEVGFALDLNGLLVRGAIDLLAELPGGERIVVDYKTDRLGSADPSVRAEGYRIQRAAYAEAVARSGPGPVRTAYVFLERPADPVVHHFADEDLERERHWLATLASELREGHFPVTPLPHRSLCHDCPARKRLCSHGWETTGREESSPPVPTG